MIKLLAFFILLVLVVIGGLVSQQITKNNGDIRCVKGHIEFNNGPVWYEVSSYQLHWPEFKKICETQVNSKTGALN